jgi:hypothetical protein
MNKFFISLFVFLGIFVFSISITNALPSGAGVNFINSSRYVNNDASSSNHSAVAGNITEILIDGSSTSQSWHGYFGNVSGGLSLQDVSSNMFYNWSSASPNGEVFASVNDSIIWTNIQCFNFTANGSYADDSANKGATSLYGMNVSILNSLYSIGDNDPDSVNGTFNSFSHPQFFVNSLQFGINECPSVNILDNVGQGVFEEVLLYSPDSRQVVFTSIIKQNTIGFDSKPHDFEMLVLEDGHGEDTDTTTYYFYLEIG